MGRSELQPALMTEQQRARYDRALRMLKASQHEFNRMIDGYPAPADIQDDRAVFEIEDLTRRLEALLVLRMGIPA